MSVRQSRAKNETESKVLLVCVYDTIIFQLTNEQIYSKFQKFGPIGKVLIFEKGQVTKFFIEFSSVQQAKAAKTALDGTKLYESICKMNIYYSNFGNVDLKHQTTQGVDYSQSQKERQQFAQKFDQLSKNSENFNPFSFDPFLDFNQLNPFQGCRSKTDDPKVLAAIWKVQIQQTNHSHEVQPIAQVDQKIKEDIFSLLESQKATNSTPNRKRQQKQSPEKINQEGIKNISNQILVFKIHNDIEIRCIYNLFSNFGNISRILKTQEQVFIKFRTMQFAAIAHSYLNTRVFFDNFMNFSFGDSESLTQKEGQYSECITYDASFDRFTPKKSITVNPPSNILHVSGIKKDLCRVNSLGQIFSQYVNVEKVSILQQSNQRNMALIRFSSIQDSFIAISELHNRTFSGRKMQISFTKSKV